jgi:hypothetical protein
MSGNGESFLPHQIAQVIIIHEFHHYEAIAFRSFPELVEGGDYVGVSAWKLLLLLVEIGASVVDCPNV